MSRMIGVCAALCLSGWTIASASQTPQVTVARYRGDKDAAASFTFDDGCRSHAEIAAPMLEEFGFRGTFYVIAGLTRESRADAPLHSHGEWAAVSWEEWRALAKRGHEIGSHSWSHRGMLHMVNDEDLQRELIASRTRVRDECGTRALTFAFPYNLWNRKSLRLARDNYMAVRSKWTDYSVPGFTHESANRHLLDAIERRGWLVPCLHGIDEGSQPFGRNQLRAHLQFVKKRETQLWVDTYVNVARYLKERDHARLRVARTEANAVEFAIDCPLDREVFDVPLTVVAQIEEDSPTKATAHLEGDAKLPVTVKSHRILVDVPPNCRRVRLTWE